MCFLKSWRSKGIYLRIVTLLVAIGMVSVLYFPMFGVAREARDGAAVASSGEAGTDLLERPRPIPAETRVTVNVNEAVGPNQDVSIEIWSDQGIIVERPMYFNYHGWATGGHDVTGL